ncbi:response regulator [Sphingomonas glaciei]|uniref:histidine kinase n=1 Tax=Sphingomonas glaciei TaxID=2938948 RepID=A0ABY5MSJ2_9SPHN|nr:response regulator [Sphingomonas glaciei]UUR06746.1 response regulator [Sphingomonas glaciei]
MVEAAGVQKAQIEFPAAIPEGEADRPRVLVVDDDERNLLAIQTVLEDVGDIVIARSGEEALRHLLKGDFAVILLDVYMPGLDGYETAGIIRSREQTKRIPIVFLSAVNKEAEHLIRGYAMGAVDYVFKPVDPMILRSKVAVFVDLFAKSREIERKAKHEQALLDANLQANNELLRAEQELRRAEQRQAAIIGSLPILLYLEPLVCDPRCPTFVSGNFEAMTGYTLPDVFETPTLWSEQLHHEDRDRVLRAIGERTASGRLSVEYRWRCKDGSFKHFHDQAVLLRDADGNPLEYAGTLTDVTERRALESQLVHAQKMDAIGKLTGGIAHDFNNLLAAVLGGLGLLERRAQLDDEHRKILDMTRRAADQGSELVRRLLAFARKQQLQPVAVNFADLHKGVDDLLSHTLGGLVELDWHLPGNRWSALVDQSQLELALMNLIINARDAMPDGGTITISTDRRTVSGKSGDHLPAGNYVIVRVSDHGTGIPPELIDKVLEPFFTTKPVGKGTGLGLSMVYGFARQSCGTFRLFNNQNAGMTAEIWLPEAAEQDIGARADVENLPISVPSLNILVVDDHPEVRMTTVGLLEDLNHRILEASSGAEALQLAKQAKPPIDLLISDYAMPHLSGTEVVKLMRNDRPGLPALLITGYADSDEIGDRPQDVMILSKPFSLDALSSAIAKVLDLSDDGPGHEQKGSAQTSVAS